ncbi:MAG: GntR family transcriptional regulator [Eubacteriales bacterium]
MIFNNNIPIYVQIIDNIKKEIISGTILPGEKLPSTRELALKYSINPNTSQKIYKEMERQNICFTKRGLGTFVTNDIQKINEIRQQMANSLIKDFIRGMTELGFSIEELEKIIVNYNDEK